MGSHIIDGEFQSDKYPSTPRGCVPLKTSDKTAQDLLFEYAQRRRSVDAEFSDDLETALKAKGFEPRGDLVLALTKIEVKMLAAAVEVAVRSGKMFGVAATAEDDLALVDGLVKLKSLAGR